MYLYLNTTERDSFRVALIDKSVVKKDKTISSARAHSEKLLKTINQLLVQTKKSVKDIAGIAVVAGPGSFTSLRVGITTANALGFALDIPVIGASPETEPAKVCQFFNKKKNQQIVLPEYGQPPNISLRVK